MKSEAGKEYHMGGLVVWYSGRATSRRPTSPLRDTRRRWRRNHLQNEDHVFSVGDTKNWPPCCCVHA
ncbi:hypothetical protein LINPERPRIM_LOCUS3180, partial [Linum perenne]